MRAKKTVLFFFMLLLFAVPQWSFADDDLQIAVLSQEMMFDLAEHGVSVLGKYADAKNIAALQKVAGAGGEMADIAKRSLKVLEAHQNGASKSELEAIVRSELGDYLYGKLKSKAIEYIKSKVTTFGELSAAYDTLELAYDSSYYVVYIGMSIGLDMMDPETVKKLEQSRFTKAADKIDEIRKEIMRNAKQGADEITEWFLDKTQDSAFDRFAEGTTEFVSETWDNAKEGAKDIYENVKNFFGSWKKKDDDSSSQKTAADDRVKDTSDTDPDSPPSGDVVADSNYASDDGGVCLPEDDELPGKDEGETYAGGDACYMPVDDPVMTSDDDPMSFLNGSSLSISEILSMEENLSGLAASLDSSFVGPNIPHYRVLWLFSGDSLFDTFRDKLKGMLNGGFSNFRNENEFKDFQNAF